MTVRVSVAGSGQKGKPPDVVHPAPLRFQSSIRAVKPLIRTAGPGMRQRIAGHVGKPHRTSALALPVITANTLI